MKKSDILLVDNAKKRPDEYEELYKKYSTDVFNYIWYRDLKFLTRKRDFRQALRIESGLNFTNNCNVL